MLNKIIISFLLILAVNANAKRADDHAPASIMGEHNHNKGEIMLSYKIGRAHV